MADSAACLPRFAQPSSRKPAINTCKQLCLPQTADLEALAGVNEFAGKEVVHRPSDPGRRGQARGRLTAMSKRITHMVYKGPVDKGFGRDFLSILRNTFNRKYFVSFEVLGRSLIFLLCRLQFVGWRDGSEVKHPGSS